MSRDFDIVVVGAGFYGCAVALSLASRGMRVALIERASGTMTRASYINQARVHNGYHYPRSVLTGIRSAHNFPRFCSDFADCIWDDFTSLYAVAREDSKITGSQFEIFCSSIGAFAREARKDAASHFNREEIEAIYETKECAFDASKLRLKMELLLSGSRVAVSLSTEVTHFSESTQGPIVHLRHNEEVRAKEVILCGYSGLNVLLGASSLPKLPLKHELTELSLVEMPPTLQRYGITVMDGPFFSVMPFPSRRLHSFSHVRYTPHFSWRDVDQSFDPELILGRHDRISSFPLMVRDAARFVPGLARAKYVGSLFEIKTILIKNESDDGRPILYRKDHGIKGLSIVLGSKIDNIYDILLALGVGDPAISTVFASGLAEQ